MRRITGFVLITLGVWLLALAPLLRFYTYPQLAKTPLDQFVETVAVAENATYLDLSSVSIKTGQTLEVTRRIVGDVDAGSDDTAVWNVFLKIEDDTGKLISASTDKVAFDRRTSIARNCCGENINGQPVKHTGIEYKFPFDTQKRTYDYFDTTLARSLPMTFAGTEKINGLDTYRFVQRIEPEKIADINVPGTLVGGTGVVPVGRFYSNTRTVWVEPRTGVVVKGAEQQFSTLRDASGSDKATITEAGLVFTDQTIRQQVKTARDGIRSLRLLGVVAPLGSALLGLIFVGLGAALVRRREDDPGESRRRRERTPATAPA
jgi:hypothetical protein